MLLHTSNIYTSNHTLISKITKLFHKKQININHFSRSHYVEEKKFLSSKIFFSLLLHYQICTLKFNNKKHVTNFFQILLFIYMYFLTSWSNSTTKKIKKKNSNS